LAASFISKVFRRPPTHAPNSADSDKYNFETKLIRKLHTAKTIVNLDRKHYNFAMANEAAKSATEAAERIAHLGRLARCEGFACALTNAQWTALRYFARANRFSRTLLAFADYHATTRGTASQTVNSLVAKGLVTRTRSMSDRRKARFDLTDEGRVVYDQDPFEVLARAIAELPQGLQTELRAALERVTGRMAREHQKPPFGACTSCLHLQECVPYEDYVADFFCRIEDSPIEESTLEKICINYEPDAGAPMKRTFTQLRC
jgi:DNA-binding MarR family transcriptional regulator